MNARDHRRAQPRGPCPGPGTREAPLAAAFAGSGGRENTRVAVSTPPRAVDSRSRATASRGSRAPAPDSLLAPGTGPALPDVGSSDDSRCFDLSGDSPATDASSVRTPSVRLPNREPPPGTPLYTLSEPCTSGPCGRLTPTVYENDIPTGSLTNRSRTLDRPMSEESPLRSATREGRHGQGPLTPTE